MVLRRDSIRDPIRRAAFGPIGGNANRKTEQAPPRRTSRASSACTDNRAWPCPPRQLQWHLAVSHRKVLAHQVVRERLHATRRDDGASLHEVEALSHTLREGQLLLDQEYGDIFLRVKSPYDLAQLVHDAWLDPFGRLVEQDALGREREGAADRQLLLLTAR